MAEQFFGTVAFVALNLANLAVARTALRRFPQFGGWLERLFVVTAAYLLSATAMVTLLGMAGLLSRGWLLALAALAGSAAALISRRRGQDGPASPASRLPGRWTLAAWGLAAGVAALWALQAFVRGIAYRSDDLSYHGFNLARWLLDQSFTLPPYVQAYYPSNSTALALWFTIPFGSDAYAGLAGFGYAALLILAVLCLLRRAGAHPGGAAVVAAALLWSHQLREAGFSLTATDLAGPALVLAAVVFTLISPAGDGWRMGTLFAGLLAGSAVGAKPSFLISAGVLLVFCVLRERRAGGSWTAAKGVGVFALAAAAGGGYWYLRNLWLAGNPVFPMENVFFAGSYPREALRDTTLAYLFSRHGSWSLAAQAATILSDWPRALAAVSLTGFLASPWLLRYLNGRQANRIAAAQVTVRVLAIGGTWLIAYPLLPFSGGNSNTFAAGAVHPDVARFLILPFACGLTLAGLIEWKGWLRLLPALAAGVLIMEEIRSRRPVLDSSLVVGAVLILAFILLEWLRRRGGLSALPATPRSALWALPLALTLWMGAMEPWKLDANRRSMARTHRLEGLLNEVDSWHDPAKTGVFKINYVYPLFGGRFQNEVLLLDPGGTPQPPIHYIFLTRRAGGTFSYGAFDPETFLNNLRSQGVDHLMLANFAGPDAWPPQRAFLADVAGAELVWEAKYLAFWKLPPGR